jgi:hypothetical protein
VLCDNQGIRGASSTSCARCDRSIYRESCSAPNERGVEVSAGRGSIVRVAVRELGGTGLIEKNRLRADPGRGPMDWQARVRVKRRVRSAVQRRPASGRAGVTNWKARRIGRASAGDRPHCEQHGHRKATNTTAAP